MPGKIAEKKIELESHRSTRGRKEKTGVNLKRSVLDLLQRNGGVKRGITGEGKSKIRRSRLREVEERRKGDRS